MPRYEFTKKELEDEGVRGFNQGLCWGFGLGAVLTSLALGAFWVSGLKSNINQLEVMNDRLEASKELLLDEVGVDASVVFKYHHAGQDVTVELPDIMADQEAIVSEELQGFEYVGPKLIRKLEWE